jgi:hypothetical protein
MQLAIVLSWTWRGSKSLKAAQRGARVDDPSTTLGFGPFSKHGALSLPPTTFGPQNRAPYNQVSVPICTKALPRELPGLGPLSTGTTLPRKGGGAPGAPMPAPRPTRPGTAPGRPPPPVGISDVTRQASTLQQRRRHGPRRAARAHWWVAGCPPAHPRGPGARPSGALVPVARAGPAPWHPNAGRAVKAPERRRAARAACRRLAHWACKARVVLLHLARAAPRRAAPRRAAPRLPECALEVVGGLRRSAAPHGARPRNRCGARRPAGCAPRRCGVGPHRRAPGAAFGVLYIAMGLGGRGPEQGRVWELQGRGGRRGPGTARRRSTRGLAQLGNQ